MRREMNAKSWDRFAKIYAGFLAKDALAYEQMYALIRRKVKDKTVLELATGTGLIAGHIVKKATHIEATDFSAEMIEKAKKNYNSTKLHFFLCRMPEPCLMPISPSTLSSLPMRFTLCRNQKKR